MVPVLPVTPATPELLSLMLADARLPTGGHTQSGGLEAAVRAGLGTGGTVVADVAAYALDRLRTVARVDAGTALVARHACLHGRPLPPVERAWAARTPSQHLRAASCRQGRGLGRLAGRVWPEVLAHLRADAETPRPVVLGVVAATGGMGPVQLARLVGYEDAQTVLSASLKLVPVDPVEVAAALVGLHPHIEALATDLAGLTDLEDLPADAAPLLDLLAAQHATARMRLFHA